MSRLEKYSRGAEAGDNEFTSFVNYMVTKKVEGNYKLKRILMICGYVLFGIIYSAVLMGTVKIPALITFLPIFIWILVYFTWLYVNIEYEYTIVGGSMKGMEVFGMRRCRELFSVRISSMTLIAPYNSKHREEADAAEIVRRDYCVSSMSSPDVYFARYKNDKGEECVVFFEMVEKTMKCLKYYNSEAVAD